MRIRKHYQLSGLLSGDSPRLPSRICSLNQSPWDVFDSSSYLPQVNGEDSFVANGSGFGNFIGATDSVTTMKISGDGEIDEGEDQEKTVLCAKTDGKSWKCKAKAARGNLLCEHHLEQLRNYQSLAHISTSSKKKTKKRKKTVKATNASPPAPVSRSSRRVRARKTPLDSNPYEYYYYSRFGPSWGKKRGSNGNATERDGHVAAAAEEEEALRCSSSEIGEIDYVDDDNEESGEMMKRRGRKRIKARSLKSLM